MVLVMQAVRVGKVCRDTAEALRCFIHHVSEGRDRSAYGFGDDVGAFVAGTQNGRVNQVLKAEGLAEAQRDHGGTFADVHRRRADSDLQVGILSIVQQAQVSGQDLCGGRGINARVRVFFKNDLSGFRLDQNRRTAGEMLRQQVLRIARVVIRLLCHGSDRVQPNQEGQDTEQGGRRAVSAEVHR